VAGDPSAPVVFGVDPGTHVCGWGVVAREGSRLVARGFGVVRARATDPVEARLATIAAGLREAVRAHAPTEAAIEDVFHGVDPRAATRIGEGRGAALVVLSEAGLPVAHYANNVVKRAVAGGGRAGKERVRAMVRATLSLASLDGPLDVSDALAVAICRHHACRPAGRAVAGSPPGTLAPRVAAALAAMRAREAARATARTRA
jgi:crossover junction endodeoxyribonuclease RuvC